MIVPKIFIESHPGDRIAWVHLEHPRIIGAHEVEVSEELYTHLKEKPLEPDNPLSELIQVSVELGYKLGDF